MQIDFETAVIGFAVLAAAFACLSFIGSGQIYRELGRTGLALDEPELHPGPAPGTAAYDHEVEVELRQMLTAKSDRRVAHGRPPLDVEAELARLRAPARVDPQLLGEVESLVVASNERRMRRGEQPLDVDAEVARRLAELGG